MFACYFIHKMLINTCLKKNHAILTELVHNPFTFSSAWHD